MEQFITWILATLGPYWPYIAAVVLPLGASWGVTQAVKYVWKLTRSLTHKRIPEAVEVALFRGIATAVCFFGVWQLWPAWGAAWMALFVAPFSSVIYGWTVKGLYHRWPNLEKWVSANPDVELKTNADGRVIGVKQGDDKTEYFNIGDPTVPRDEEK